MKIIIPYNSKWSACMSDKETRKSKTVSLGAVQEKTNKETIIELNENDNYESVMMKIKTGFENFDYQPISKNTVLGILSRLFGEIRYLDKVLEDPDHLINILKDKVSFSLLDRELYNEVINIATPVKEVQNNGGAFISNSKSNFCLLSKNQISEIIYSLFNLKNLNQIDDFMSFLQKDPSLLEMTNYIKSNSLEFKENYEIYMFIKKYQEHVKDFSIYDNEYRKFLAGKIPSNNEILYYENLIKKIGIINTNNPLTYLSSKYINIIGILIYSVVFWFERIGQRELIEGVLIKQKGNIEGIATNSGGLTIKDLYSRVAPKKQSWSSPYMFDTKYLKKQNAKQFNPTSTKLGVGKENGILEIYIDVNEDIAKELEERIKCVGVSTFQMGKKGLAYVKEIRTDE